MYEVYRDRDSTKVGLFNGLLKDSGIETMLLNWSGSNITEIPIPTLFPNICVFTKADFSKAIEIIRNFENPDTSGLEDWTCPNCGEENGGNFSECWSCQTPVSE